MNSVVVKKNNRKCSDYTLLLLFGRSEHPCWAYVSRVIKDFDSNLLHVFHCLMNTVANPVSLFKFVIHLAHTFKLWYSYIWLLARAFDEWVFRGFAENIVSSG